MTRRVLAAADNVAVQFEGLDGLIAHAEIWETTAPHGAQLSFDLKMRGLLKNIRDKAMEGAISGRFVKVRVLGFEGSWIVVTSSLDDFVLRQSGPLEHIPS